VSASPQRAPRLPVCHVPCLGHVLHARIRLNEALATTILAVSAFVRPPRQAFACARALTTVTSCSLHVFESVSHLSAPLQQPVSLSPLSPFATASSRRLNQPCLRAVCACDPAPAARGAQRAARGLPGGLAGRADGRTAGRWLPVAQGGRQGSTRRRWKRPFDFPILPTRLLSSVPVWLPGWRHPEVCQRHVEDSPLTRVPPAPSGPLLPKPLYCHANDPITK
jgi:hypothetical protein